MKIFIFDAAKCNGCYSCQLVCKDEHVENDWMPIARPQPDTGHFWMKMREKTHGQIPKVKVEYRAVPCMHCDEAPCLTQSRDGSVYKRPDGLVIIDPVKAQNQKNLVDSCPYQAIYWNESLQIPQKCTGCAHLVDEGREPRCSEACPTGALIFGEEEDLQPLLEDTEVLGSDYGTKPRVYYRNPMKSFIAGDVYDPINDECLKDCQVTLTATASGQTWVTNSDHFGDFWFKKMAGGTYTLSIAKEGYIPYRSDSFTLTESLNLGEILLKRS